MRSAQILEDPLAAQATHRVLSDRLRRILFRRSAAGDGREPVDVPGREGNDTTLAVLECDQPRQKAVHGPSLRLHARRPEFHREHGDHVGHFGKMIECGGLEQITPDRFDATFVEPRLAFRIGESSDSHNTSVAEAQGVKGAAGHPGQSRAHLAGHSEDDQVAFEASESVNDSLGRRAEQTVELLDIGDHLGNVGRVVDRHFASDGPGCSTLLRSRAGPQPAEIFHDSGTTDHPGQIARLAQSP